MNRLILKTLISAFYFMVVLFNSCSRPDQDDFKFKIVEYPGGAIREMQRLQNGDPFGVYIKFTPKMELESVGHYDSDESYGLVSRYINDNLAQIVQYVNYNGSISVNQRWTFDGYGNLYKDKSIFYVLSSDADSVYVSTPYNISIELVCPPVKDAKMFVRFGNFDEQFRLIDSVGLSDIEGINGKVHKTFTFSVSGEKLIRGIIYSTTEEEAFPIYFTHAFMVNSK